MKVAVVLLLAVLAVVSASGFYEGAYGWNGNGHGGGNSGGYGNGGGYGYGHGGSGYGYGGNRFPYLSGKAYY